MEKYELVLYILFWCVHEKPGSCLITYSSDMCCVYVNHKIDCGDLVDGLLRRLGELTKYNRVERDLVVNDARFQKLLQLTVDLLPDARSIDVALTLR